MRYHTRRLRKVGQAIDAWPIAPAVAKAAYEHFRETGELPDDKRVAGHIVHRIKAGLANTVPWTHSMDMAGMIRACLNAPKRAKDDVMDALLDEAVWAPEQLRWAARRVLEGLSDTGMDVTQPLFAGRDMKLPDFGSTGLFLLGLPECLAKPPYEEQAHRLFERYAVLRNRINQDDKRWFDALAEAIGLFQESGELPDDELMRDAVLADGEMVCLMRHSRSEEVGELMAAFDRAAKAEGDERKAAIRRVQVLAAEGHFADPE